MAWIDKDGNVRSNNTNFMYGKFGDIDGIDNARDDNRVANVSSDDGMEGRLNKDLINVMKIVQHIDKLIDCKGGIGDYDRGYRASLKELRAWLGAVL